MNIQILLQGWRQWGNQRLHAVVLAVLLLAAAAVGVAAALGHWRQSMVLGATLLAAGLAVAWMALVADLRRQNHPELARLVPGHVAQLRLTLLVGWLLVSVAATGVLWLLGMPWARAWLYGVAAVALLAALAVYPLMWFLVWVPQWAAGWLQRRPALQGWGAWHEQHAGLVALATTLVLGLALARMVQTGDPRHRARQASEQRWRNASRLSGNGQVPGAHRDLPAALRMLGWLQQAPYQAWLPRCLARQAEPMERLVLGMGPALHWTGVLGAAACAVLVLALVAALIGVLVLLGFKRPLLEQGLPTGAVVGLCIALASSTASVAVAVGGTLWHTRSEQALLMLLPGVPRGARLNQGLAWRMALLGLGTWALGSAAILALAWGTPVQPAAALLVLALLGNAALLWGRWSHLRSPAPWQPLVPVAAPVAAVGLGWLLHQHAGLPLAAWAAALGAAALLLGAWRWRVQRQAPAVLPAGRCG